MLLKRLFFIFPIDFQGPPAYKILQDAVYTAAEDVSMVSIIIIMII